MTTRKKKIRDKIQASSEKFTTTKKLYTMKGGVIQTQPVQQPPLQPEPLVLKQITQIEKDVLNTDTKLTLQQHMDFRKKCQSNLIVLQSDFNDSNDSKKEPTELLKILNQVLDNMRLVEILNKKTIDISDQLLPQEEEKEKKQHIGEKNTTIALLNQYHIFINKTMMPEIITKQTIDFKYYWVKSLDDNEKKRYLPIGIIKEVTRNPYDGSWSLTVWVPNEFSTNTVLIRDTTSSTSGKKLSVKVLHTTANGPRAGDHFDTFSVREWKLFTVSFEDEHTKYNIDSVENVAPLYEEKDLKKTPTSFSGRSINRLSSAFGLPQVERDTGNSVRKRIPSILNSTDLKQGSEYVGKTIERVSSREVRTQYKEYIKKLIAEIAEKKKDDKNLLNKKIKFGKNKQQIRTILISKISYILAQGQSRFDLYNTQKMKQEYEGTDEANSEDGTEPGNGTQDGAGAKPVAKAIQEGGLLVFTSRDVSKDDSERFIKFILDRLREITYLGTDDQTKEELQEKYLQVLFKKIGSVQLHVLLGHMDISEKISKHTIGYFKNKLYDKNTTQDNPAQEKPAQDATDAIDVATDHVAEISKLNFGLKHNMNSLVTTIIDITLNIGELQEFQDNKDGMANHLDINYSKAMNIPFGDEKKRISNFELAKALREIFDGKLGTLVEYKEKIKNVDELIDSIDNDNIRTKITEIGSIIKVVRITDTGINYKMPAKMEDIMKNAPESTSMLSPIELAKIHELTEKLKALNTDAERESLLNDWLSKLPTGVAIGVAQPTKVPTLAVAQPT